MAVQLQTAWCREGGMSPRTSKHYPTLTTFGKNVAQQVN